MSNRGLTLTEVLMVVSIIGILVIAMGFQFIGWYSDYKVESVTKDIYADLLDARAKAMQRNRPYYMDFNFPAPPANMGRYRMAESRDLNADGYVDDGDLDGNGQIDPGHAVDPAFPKLVDYVLTRNTGSIITFDKRGIIDTTGTGTICVTSNTDPALRSALVPDNAEISPDYDCIVVAQTRINIGKLTQAARRAIILTGNAAVCNPNNCDTK